MIYFGCEECSYDVCMKCFNWKVIEQSETQLMEDQLQVVEEEFELNIEVRDSKKYKNSKKYLNKP